tara:strand:- start:305 stop:715 length:411 start_codon:yes stop_codon:yes gene_type:complete
MPVKRVRQEFYCRKLGGGCGRYFVVKINIALNHVVIVICPGCKHEHKRSVIDGTIRESGRHDNVPVEKLIPPKSALSNTPKTKKMKENEKDRKKKPLVFRADDGDSVVIYDEDDVVENAKNRVRNLWFRNKQESGT